MASERQERVTRILDKMETLCMFRLNNGLVLHGESDASLDSFEGMLDKMQSFLSERGNG